MGSERLLPRGTARPSRRVDGFWIDEHPVTVAEFRRFVKTTGLRHVGRASARPGRLSRMPIPELLVPGSLVFTGSPGPVDLDDIRNWWTWMPGAYWRHPEGPGSTLARARTHPVIHVAYEDAAAYAAWAGKELPTEAEWEYAARGGLEGKTFTWGDEFAPKGRMMANTWQGEFPWQNLLLDGYERHLAGRAASRRTATASTTWPATSGSGPTTSSHRPPRRNRPPCCTPHNPRVTSPDRSYDPDAPGAHIPRRVIKGGSHLCAPNYCLRYRPAARQGEPIDTHNQPHRLPLHRATLTLA